MTYKKLTREFILKTVKNGEQPAIKIRQSKDAADYARAFYGDDIEIYESVFIILLNRANNTIGWAKIGQGGVAGCSVDRKIVCKYAIDSLASGVILVHNHPSGNLLPSTQDTVLARALKSALGTLDINFLDSIIITSDGYRSMFDESDY